LVLQSKKAQKVLAEHDREYPSKFLLKMLIAEPRLLFYSRFVLLGLFNQFRR